MNPKIIQLPPKTLVGISIKMSMVNNLTGKLWRTFMPRRNEVLNKVNGDFLSLQVYPEKYFKSFNPATMFTKYALVEVSDLSNVPEGMNSMKIEGGMYAVFHHIGNDTSVFQEIFTQWLPNSEYALDNRPHFEVLGEKYKNHDPRSEEDIYIPIKPKANE